MANVCGGAGYAGTWKEVCVGGGRLCGDLEGGMCVCVGGPTVAAAAAAGDLGCWVLGG